MENSEYIYKEKIVIITISIKEDDSIPLSNGLSIR